MQVARQNDSKYIQQFPAVAVFQQLLCKLYRQHCNLKCDPNEKYMNQ